MLNFLRLSSLILLAGGTIFAAEVTDVATQVHLASEQLARYHDTDPVPSDRKLRFGYFSPSDRAPAIDYRARLTRVVEETAGFFQQELERVGFRPKPMQLDRAEDGLLRFVVVPGREPWLTYNTKEWPSAKRVQDECRPAFEAAGIDLSRETVALFTTIMEWDETRLRFRQVAPYRGGGDARQGFCWQIDAPPLDPRNLAARQPIVDDGEFGRISLGDWNSRFVGGVIHELGHALGLPHNMEREQEGKTLGTSLMGNGNLTYGREQRGEGPGAFLTLADAMRLASHPFFTGSRKGLGPRDSSTGRFDKLEVEVEHHGIVVRGRVESSPATYAIIAYTDPNGRSDYDAFTSTAVPDSNG